ncbi:type II secretion system minor pseudopilin GspH [Parendozoicomonas haliclonae]|uniref:Type II secretion system protein H n=2 Tax=Parendozoicomonas haliclonae TaxID=1960125 RepID=A0A1X7AM53_9GAMM|nr:hypothetical protein EHSB41UT_03166 [Parendozoicomonas haliclonae]
MRRGWTCQGKSQGFTLIEILVVLLIIGLVVGLALVTPRSAGPGQQLQEESNRLQILIEQARERALMEDRELGFSLSGQFGYRWWVWSREQEIWQELEEQSFRTYKLPDGVLLNDVSGKNSSTTGSRFIEEAKKTPSWVMYSDNQMTPFRLEFSLRDDDRRTMILESDGIGPVTSP